MWMIHGSDMARISLGAMRRPYYEMKIRKGPLTTFWSSGIEIASKVKR